MKTLDQLSTNILQVSNIVVQVSNQVTQVDTHITATGDRRIPIDAVNTPTDGTDIFTISQPGSYYLTANVNGVSSKSGIKITTSNVTIDLNGYSLFGNSVGTLAITFAGTLHHIAIRNGDAINWLSGGISLGSAAYVTFENLRTQTTGGSGISASGDSTVIRNCVAVSAGVNGIATGARSLVIGCIANSCSQSGILVGVDSVVRDCSVSSNGTGITGNSGCRIIDCIASSNVNEGILDTNGRGSISGCTARLNNVGISAQRGVISGNTVSENEVDGIKVTNRALIINNICEGNGNSDGNPGVGAGIHVTLNGSRIEGNTCVSNDIGIDVDAGTNFIIRNFVASNTTDFSLAAGNFTGTQVSTEATMNSAANANVNMVP
jgi:hypothetical protein